MKENAAVIPINPKKNLSAEKESVEKAKKIVMGNVGMVNVVKENQMKPNAAMGNAVKENQTKPNAAKENADSRF